MTNKESELLDDIEAWRKADLAKTDRWHYITGRVCNEFSLNLCRVSSVSSAGKYSRVELEPEMVEAIDRVREAISMLEVARTAIVERKLRELRAAESPIIDLEERG